MEKLKKSVRTTFWDTDKQREHRCLGRQDWKAKFSFDFDETLQLDTTKFETFVSTLVLLCYYVRPLKERGDLLSLVFFFYVQGAQLFAKFATFVKFATFFKFVTLQGAPPEISFEFSPTLWQIFARFAIFAAACTSAHKSILLLKLTNKVIPQTVTTP